MILISYGITKSGSTLAFELAKGILAAAGHEQIALPGTVVEPNKRINFITGISGKSLDALIAAVPNDHIVAVKTHAAFPVAFLPKIDRLVSEGHLKVHAAYRDPREIILSMIDAGEKARKKGRAGFANVRSMDAATESVEKQLDTFMRWASVQDALRLAYNRTAFDTEEAVRTMADHLSVEVDAPKVARTVTSTAFTQKNKAVKDRYKDELTVRENEYLFAMFKTFIENACVFENEDWFKARRERLLTVASEKKPAAA